MLTQQQALLCASFGFCVGLIPSILLCQSGMFLSSWSRPSDTDTVCVCPPQTLGFRTNRQESINSQQTNSKPQQDTNMPKVPRKVLLDCGGNVASTVLLFRETYPGGRDYTIHSFEIDDRLAPYFKPYDNHYIHCPVGVAGKDGNMTAYSEVVWSPQKGLNHGADMQWGGGSLFVSGQERKDTKTGGYRKLSYRKTIPVIDLSKWITETFSIDDYIILKLDVEGAEYEILRKMLNDKAFSYIDKFYGEYHDWQPTGWSKVEKNKLRSDIAKTGLSMLNWVGERRTYADIEKVHPIKVPPATPGKAGNVYSSCASGSVALAVAVGMNFKRAQRVVDTLAAHNPVVPTTLFVYGDFVQLFPDAVRSWSKTFNIGIREDGHNPLGHLDIMPGAWVRMALISAILRLEEIGVVASHYLPTVKKDISRAITQEAKTRGLRVVKAAVEFPAKEGSTGELTWDNYYRYRDVERVPKALRKIHEALAKNNGGVLVVDSDLPDMYMNSVFMMDYLVETSGFKLVNMDVCIAKSR